MLIAIPNIVGSQPGVVQSFLPLFAPLADTRNKKHRRRNISMVRIRLRRTGSKGQSSYRIVVADKESPRDGRFLEILGFYNPRTEPGTFDVKEDRVYEWMKNGALPTESVAQLFKSAGVTDRFERLKKGESAEVLLAEAEQAKAARVINNKTRK
jgi:small subunit ribosomal protein S16